MSPAVQAPSIPRLLVQPAAGPDLAAHERIYGPVQLPAKHPEGGPLLQEVLTSKLRGRGGAWFPTGLKMRSVLDNANRHRHNSAVLCNGMEGEPISFTDKWLLTNAPHLVLDGIELAGRVVGAKRLLLALHDDSPALPTVRTAIAQRRGRSKIELVTPPARYVASEESALISWIDAQNPRPSYGRRPFQSGVRGWPTLVNNAETLSHVALIARFGAQWWASVGGADAPGTVLVSVSGALVDGQRAVEVPVGTRTREVLEEAGDVVGRPTAVLTGGFGGTWASLDRILDAPWDPDVMRGLGVGIGAGALWVQSEGQCGIAETARVLRYLAGESAGQCGACAFGLEAIAEEFAQLTAGQLPANGLSNLHMHLRMIPRRGGCALPDGAVRMAQSALDVFRRDVSAHMQGSCMVGGGTGEVRLPVPPALPTPAIAPGRKWR